jgi:diacylglycerol kinase (ATP)
MNSKKRIRILVNPSARSGRGLSAVAALRATPLPQWLDLEWRESRSAAHFIALVQEAQAVRPDLSAIGIAGGDGTVTMALEALARMKRPARVPLGILPVGSGNDFAHDIGVSRDPRTALSILIHGSPRHVDIAEATTEQGARVKRFCCVASVGLDELALRRIHGSRLPRSQGLNMYAALRALIEYRPRRVRLRWQGGEFEGEAMFCAITNTRSYGGGFRVCPKARVDDGALDLCIVRRTSKPRLLMQFPRILRGTHCDLPEVIMATSPWVELDVPPGEGQLPLCIDGELPSAATPARLSCLPRALLLMTPIAEAPAAQPASAA